MNKRKDRIYSPGMALRLLVVAVCIVAFIFVPYLVGRIVISNEVSNVGIWLMGDLIIICVVGLLRAFSCDLHKLVNWIKYGSQ